MSESIYLVLIPTVLLVSLRCADRPSYGRFAVVGLTVGLAALTRGEALTLVLLIGVPLVLFASRKRGERTRFGLALVAAFTLIVGPLVVRNLVQMGGLTLSTDTGTTLVGAYNSATFSPDGPLYGSFDGAVQFGDAAVVYRYQRPPNRLKHWTELTLNDALGRLGTTYARQHLADLPGVMLAREGRLWGVYDTGSELSFDLASDGDGVRSIQLAGQYVNWVLLPLAVSGGIILYRRARRDLVIVVAPIVATGITAALTFGSTRYRALAEPSIALLAAVGSVVLIECLLRARGHGPTVTDEEPVATGASARDSSGTHTPE